MPQENADSAAFVAQHGLDEKCSRAFSELTGGDQTIVMEIVNKRTECKNPSAFTWSIVRKLNENPGHVKLDYILPRLDERCLKEMNNLPRHVQEQVVFGVDVEKCRNLSAFVFSQIRAMMSNQGAMMPQPRAAMPTPAARGAAPGYRQDARSRSPYGGGGGFAHERTEDLMARMGELQRELASRQAGNRGPSRGATQWAAPPPQPRGPRQGGGGGGMMGGGLDSGAQEALDSLDPEGQQIATILVSNNARGNPSRAMWATVKQVNAERWKAKAGAVRASLDEGALAGFDQLSPEAQAALVESVDILKCRNISAFVWSRIKTGEYGDVQAQPMPKPRVRALPNVGKVAPDSGFGLDERCEQELKSLPQEVQDAILAEVPSNCRNISAYVWSKVKNFKQPPNSNPSRRQENQSSNGMAAPSTGLEMLDEACAAEFHQLPQDVQQMIVAEVPDKCRNISAWVWSRIKGFKSGR